jgi:hypothetical protein
MGLRKKKSVKSKKRKSRAPASTKKISGDEHLFMDSELDETFSTHHNQVNWTHISTPLKGHGPPPTPNTASPSRGVFRSPFLDVNIFTSPAKGLLKTPGKMASPLKAGFSPFSAFVVNLSPLRQQGSHSENLPHNNETANPFEGSPLGSGLTLLSNLGSAVKDGAVILNDTSSEGELEEDDTGMYEFLVLI